MTLFIFLAIMYLRFLCAIYMTEHLCVYICSMHVGYTLDPQNLLLCENQTIPTMFTMTCQYNSTSFLSTWLVTGLASMTNRTISPQDTSVSFIPQGRVLPGGVGESTLTVNSQEVTAITCFQCAISTLGGANFRSKQGCVTAVGE